MDTTDVRVTFDDLGLLDPAVIRTKVWTDLFKQHRIPEAYRLSLRTWAQAIAQSNLLVANRLMLAAPANTRARIGAMVVYQATKPEEGRSARELIATLYKYDIMRVKDPLRASEEKGRYGSARTPSEIVNHVDLRERVMLDTQGVASATQFVDQAAIVYSRVPDLEELQRVYRTVMDMPNDVLRVVVGGCDAIELPTGRLDYIRAKPSEISRVKDGRRCLDEFMRVLRPGGLLFIEGAEKDVARLEGRYPDLRVHSPLCVSLMAE
jgi:hypothetical protein